MVRKEVDGRIKLVHVAWSGLGFRVLDKAGHRNCPVPYYSPRVDGETGMEGELLCKVRYKNR